ncbi:hypothetical protein EIP86_010157 [Pleurotus ostreatoroseus]|nr:hypothetical protein EIP86_010157 [Pleurotus ostreatoroseus]
MNISARYVSLVFMAQTNAAVGVLFAWCGNTFPSPPAKRAVALAFINAAGNLVSVPSSPCD